MDPLDAIERLAKLFSELGIYAACAVLVAALGWKDWQYRKETRAHVDTLRDVLPLMSALEKLLERQLEARHPRRRPRISQSNLPAVPPEDT